MVKLGAIDDSYATKYLKPKGVKIIRLSQNTSVLEVAQGNADFLMAGYLSLLRNP